LPEELEDTGVGCVETYTNMGVGWATLGNATTINGQVEPTIAMQPGELHRWRLGHGGIGASINLAIVEAGDDWALPTALPTTPPAPGPLDLEAIAAAGVNFVPMQVIAEDGIAYGRMDEHLAFRMDPGYRVDALVRIDEPGEYLLVDLPEDAQTALQLQDENASVLARLTVEGEAQNDQFPSADALSGLAPYAHIENGELTGCQRTVFNVVPEGLPGGPQYTVNGRAFHGDDTPCQLPLGEAQEWRLEAQLGNHPYHIHVNPFEIQVEDGPNIWKDTVLVPEGGSVTIRTRYRRFTGTFVMHCHILEHEDHGMMQAMEVMEDPPALGSPDSTCVPCLEGPGR